MQVPAIQNRYNNYNKRNIYNGSGVSFQGGKQKLIAISADSFSSEYTKNLCSKIQNYFRLIGESGNIKEVKLLHEKKRCSIPKEPYIIDVDADICLSINRGDRNSNIKLYHKFSDGKSNDELMFDVTLDKNGQMIRGQFFPDALSFERDGKNVRRMYSSCRGDSYLPVGDNDREWSCLGKDNLPSLILRYRTIGVNKNALILIDDSEKSAFEIFIELARLKTSII